MAIRTLTRSFDASAEKLPPKFLGHDIKALYTEMSARSSAGAKKGEFETTEEFHARVQREAAEPVLGNLAKNGLFAFTLTNTSGEALYDADQRTMTVALVLSRASKDIYTSSNKKALTSKGEVREDTYEGSNAYGAKVQVTRLFGTDYQIAFTNYENFGFARYINSRTRSSGYTTDIHANDAILIQVWKSLQPKGLKTT